MLPRRVFLVFALVLLGVCPALAQEEAPVDGDSAVGIFVPSVSDAGKLSPFGTENIPRRVTSGATANDLIRLAPGLGYEVTPGDVYTFDIYHYGGSGGNPEHLLVQVPVEDDYTLYLPLVGPINARGLTFTELRKTALARLRSSVRLQHADVVIFAPALFTVFVSGAVAQPGSIAVNGLTRVSDVIDRAGGALAGASWRRVEYEHAGQTTNLDLLRWASGYPGSANPMVRPGDTIRVPITATGAVIRGRVRYPGSYELLAEETVSDLLELAGGTLSGADIRQINVTRVQSSGEYNVLNVDLTVDPSFRVQDGDVVNVISAGRNAPMVMVEGALFGSPQDPNAPVSVPRAPINIQVPLSNGLTLLAILDRLGGPTPYAEAARAYVQHAGLAGERVAVDVGALWSGRDSGTDLVLQPGDRIVVPMRPLNIMVLGEVNRPGSQIFASGQEIRDYIRAAGGVVDGRGNPGRFDVVDRDGVRRTAGPGDEVAPGETIIVTKQVAASVGDFFQDNVFVITGIAVTIVGIATTVIEFARLVASLLPTSGQ